MPRLVQVVGQSNAGRVNINKKIKYNKKNKKKNKRREIK